MVSKGLKSVGNFVGWLIGLFSGILAIMSYLGQLGFDPFHSFMAVLPNLVLASYAIFFGFLLLFIVPKIILRIHLMILEGKPVVARRDSFRIVGRNPIHTGLLIGEIRLNKTPNHQWIECYKKPKEWMLSLRVPYVAGNKIRLEFPEDMADIAVEWAIKAVDMANQKYAELLSQQQELEKIRQQREAEERRRIEELERRVKINNKDD